MSKKKDRLGGQARTNSMRFLDARRVQYEVLSFSPDIHSATEAAAAIGADPSAVYKTLVVERTRGKPLLVMVAGDKQVDLGMLGDICGREKAATRFPQ